MGASVNKRGRVARNRAAYLIPRKVRPVLRVSRRQSGDLPSPGLSLGLAPIRPAAWSHRVKIGMDAGCGETEHSCIR
jgi:hypothetical protein